MAELANILALYLAPIALSIIGCYLMRLQSKHPLPKVIAMFMLISSVILFMTIAGEATKSICSMLYQLEI